MSTVLEQALEELKAMPADAQEAIAQDLLDMIRSERKWDELFADLRSEALMERMVEKVRGDIAAGRVIKGDPSNTDGPSAEQTNLAARYSSAIFMAC
jgi:hypothetical protein